MDIGISLPSTAPQTYAEDVLDWAVAVEDAGFDSVAVLGGTERPGYDPVVTLSAVGGATRKVRMLGGFLVDENYPLGLLARQIASLDHLSGHRVQMSIGVGSSVSDFFAHAPETGESGSFEAHLAAIRAEWLRPELHYAGSGRPAGPELLLGGRGAGAAGNVARFGDGWMGAGADIDLFGRMVGVIRDAWSQAQRPGRPRFTAMRPFAFGPSADATADAYVQHRYGTSAQAKAYRASVVTDPGLIPEILSRLATTGCDEVVFVPCGSQISQMERMAEHALHSEVR